MNVLITGGAGFLGQYLTQACAEHGHRVRVIDLQPPRRPAVPVERYCDQLSYQVDITKPETLRGHFDGVEAVFHLAGLVSFWTKAEQALMRVNVDGTENVLREASRSGISRLVHISSVAAVGYNDDPRKPLDESFPFDWARVPNKHYMRSKRFAEEKVFAACDAGLNATVANPGLMWGPGDLLNSSKLIAGLKRGTVPACPPGGTNIVDVRDVARGLLAFLSQGQKRERYILGGDNLTFREVYDTIAGALGVRAPRLTLPRLSRPLLYHGARLMEALRGSPPALTADNIDSSFLFRYFSSAKAEREVGWTRQFTFADTIRDSVAWLSSQALLP